MKPQAPHSLGVLRTERGVPPGTQQAFLGPGYLVDPATFDFPVISETVEGGWVDRVLRGDPALKPAYIAAARRLVERGAVAISSSCGYAIRYQAEVAASVNVPVAMSSLLLLPGLLRQLPRSAKLAVLVADATCLGEDMLGIDDPEDRARVVVGGVEGGIFLRNEMMRPPPPTQVGDVEKDVVACLTRLRAAHPEIAAILLECTAFPCAAPTVRQLTKLPVYDVTTLCRITMASVGVSKTLF